MAPQPDHDFPGLTLLMHPGSKTTTYANQASRLKCHARLRMCCIQLQGCLSAVTPALRRLQQAKREMNFGDVREPSCAIRDGDLRGSCRIVQVERRDVRAFCPGRLVLLHFSLFHGLANHEIGARSYTRDFPRSPSARRSVFAKTMSLAETLEIGNKLRIYDCGILRWDRKDIA